MIDLKNKLKNMPTIYYVNLDNRNDRREYMESQFDQYKINFKRISASKYLASEYEQWKHLISNKKNYTLIDKPATANFITHIEMIKEWLETTNEQFMIMMEDDYDLSLIEYWNFDWDYLMNQIPFDCDCLQLGFESFHCIHFFLHPKLPATYFGACMITRFYAEKLVRLYYDNIENKYIVDNETNDIRHLNKGFAKGTVDYSICENGKTYCIPLIPQNPHFSSHENYHQRSYDYWEHVFDILKFKLSKIKKNYAID